MDICVSLGNLVVMQERSMGQTGNGFALIDLRSKEIRAIRVLAVSYGYNYTLPDDFLG